MVGVLAVVPFVYVVWELLRARPIRLENLFFLLELAGSFEHMNTACTRLEAVHLVLGAGHSIVEEQPEAVNRLLIEFLTRSRLT
jgi:pimeloyl-ACP methyl ester carboxylesterase